MSAITRRENSRKRAVRIGVGAMIGALLVTVFAVTAQNGLPDYAPGVNRTTVKVAFANVGALRKGDDIRIAGVRAGYVQSIGLVNGKPVVTGKLDHGNTVYSNATARIAARSSLGQKYVDLTLGTPKAKVLGSDDVLPVKQTTSGTELDDVLGTFDPATRAAAGVTLRNLGGGLGGRGDGLNDALRAGPDMLSDASSISNALSENNGEDLTQLLQSARSLASALDDQSTAIKADVRQLAGTVSAFDSKNGRSIGETIRKAPDTLSAARQALNSLNVPLDATRTAAIRLRPGAVALGKATTDTRGLLRDAVDPLQKIPAVGKQAETAITSLSPVVKRAQKTSASIRTAMTPLAIILSTLAPYSSEALDFFTNAASALHLGDSNGNWLRIAQIFAPEMALGLKTPLHHREAYPAPGEAAKHRTNTLGGLLK